LLPAIASVVAPTPAEAAATCIGDCTSQLPGTPRQLPREQHRASLRQHLRRRLAEKPWRHPTTGEFVRFGLSTIERWYYAARAGSNPVGVLRRKLRRDSGRFLAIKDDLGQALRRQCKEHPSWSCKLHLDNLAVRIALDPDLGAAPSYPTLRRFMAAPGLAPAAPKAASPGA